MIDYCNVMLQIAQFPREKLQKWGILTVREFLAFEEHVHNCLNCTAIMNATVEKYKDEPRQIDPSSLN